MNHSQRITLFLCALLLITTLLSACTGTKPTDTSLQAGDASASTNTDTSNAEGGMKNHKFADIADSIKLIGRTEVTDRVLACVDVLVDGPFIEELKDISARFRGSSNQRIVDVPATLAAGEIVEWRGDETFAERGTW
jgi:hypothetical protein